LRRGKKASLRASRARHQLKNKSLDTIKRSRVIKFHDGFSTQMYNKIYDDDDGCMKKENGIHTTGN
jgi:hypothetical protein